MKNIKECAEVYTKLLKKTFVVTLQDNFKLILYFRPENFYHLLGLHKLTDINSLTTTSLSRILKQVLSENITQKEIEKSLYYHEIENRIKHFEDILEMLDIEKSNKIVIDFDASLVPGGTKLVNTKFILYKRFESGYSNTTIGKNNKGYYPETFIFEASNKYISDQTLLDIKNIEVIDRTKKTK